MDGRFWTKLKLQPAIFLTASPYPLVTRETNVTLQCTGRAADPQPGVFEQVYILRIDLKRNGKSLPVDVSCQPNDYSLKLRSLTCTKHVTNISDSDNFECFVFPSSFAPCNSDRISFKVRAKHPMPRIIKPIKRTSQSVVIQWKSVPLNETIYGELTGYKVVLKDNDVILNFNLPSNQRRFQTKHLIPKTNYSFIVSGLTENGEGHKAIINFMTLDVIPRPQEVMIANILENSVSIHWTPVPPNVQKYDKILGYRIILRDDKLVVHNKTVTSSETFINLANLLPNTNYKASVVGYGVNGDGNVSDWKNFKTFALPVNQVPSSQKSDYTGIIIAVVASTLVGIGILVVMLAAALVAHSV